jgi:hypothetical protein
MILLKSGKFQITIILICKKVIAENEKGRDGVVYMPEGLIGEKGVDLFNQRVKISPDFLGHRVIFVGCLLMNRILL